VDSERHRAVQFSSKRSTFWYIHPKVNAEPQTPQNDNMAPVSTDYIFNSKKLLQDRRKGHIPTNVSNMFKTFLLDEEIKHPGTYKTRVPGEFTTFRRLGVRESASSFFIAVKNSIGPIADCELKDDPGDYEGFASCVKRKLATMRIDAASQSIYDKTKDELIEMCDHKDVYKDPRIWAPIFEEIFERNVFLFKIDEAVTPDGDIVIPRHKSFYVGKELWYRKSIIIIMDRINNKPFPFQCEYVIDEITNSEVYSEFNMINPKYKRLTEALIKYLILRNDFKLISGVNQEITSSRPTSSSSSSRPTSSSSSRPTSSSSSRPTSSSSATGSLIEIGDSEDEDSQSPAEFNFKELDENKRKVQSLKDMLGDIDDTTIVLRGDNNISIRKKSLVDRLIGDWLDDDIIFYTIQKIYQSLDNNRRREVAFSISPILSDGNLSSLRRYLEDYSDNIQELKTKLGMLAKGGVDWTDNNVKTILTPFNLNENHWILVRIDKPEQKGGEFEVSVYDSILGSLDTYEDLKTDYSKLLVLLFGIKEKRVKFHIVEDLPQQKDVMNCGIFTLLFANAILRKREPIESGSFSTNQAYLTKLRWRIAVRLLKQEVPLT